MQPKLQPNKVRLSIQIPSELKSKLSKLSVFQGKKVSVLVRESIEEKLEEKNQEGKSKAEALKLIQDDFEIDDSSVKLLLGQKITPPDLELLYTSVENPIYEALTEVEDGRWGVMDGESLLDHSYYMGSHLKVWEWRKREEVEKETEMVIEEMSKSSNKK